MKFVPSRFSPPSFQIAVNRKGPAGEKTSPARSGKFQWTHLFWGFRFVVAVLVQWILPGAAHAEDHVDYRYEYYKEDGDRMVDQHAFGVV